MDEEESDTSSRTTRKSAILSQNNIDTLASLNSLTGNNDSPNIEMHVDNMLLESTKGVSRNDFAFHQSLSSSKNFSDSIRR